MKQKFLSILGQAAIVAVGAFVAIKANEWLNKPKVMPPATASTTTPGATDPNKTS